MSDYRQFKDSAELIAQLAKGFVLYQAPLDWRPYSIKVKRFTVDFERPLHCRLTFWSSETKTLTVDFIEQFDRFKTHQEAL